MAKCEEMIMESILPFSANPADGLFLIEDVDGNGNMKGKYRKAGGNPGDEEEIKNGKCKENEKKFECERVGFKYDGSVFSFNNDEIVVVVGKRSPKQDAKREKGGKEANGDEVWVGVKTST